MLGSSNTTTTAPDGTATMRDELGCSAMEGTHLLLAVTRIQPDAEKIASDAMTHLLQAVTRI